MKVGCCLRVVNTIIGPMAIGGQFSPIPYIFNLVCSGSGMDIRSSCYWRKLEQTLHFPRASHVVIPLGDSFAHKMCNTGMGGYGVFLSCNMYIQFQGLLFYIYLRMPYPMCLLLF